MQIIDATTATPSAAYVKVTGPAGPVVQPYVPFGNPSTGGLTAPSWAELASWLFAAKREVEYEMRKNLPGDCAPSTNGQHWWELVESGCERSWSAPEVTITDDDEGRAEGAPRITVVADGAREDAVGDGEAYYLLCRACMAEVNIDEIDFV